MSSILKHEQEEAQQIAKAKWIIWLDYYTEGWQPRPCQTWDEVLAHIQDTSQPFVITQGIVLLVPQVKETN